MSDQRYLVTARKYRPQRFNEIVAQEHVSETLKNALRLDRLAHAYLFSGPRGVGKTTAARILAKAINCTVSFEDREDGEPCRTCESCRTFEEGRSLNIIEIDAASNNRVEDIRDLRDTVLIPPQGSRKKVYIIDEVHMLSNAAFNALLKTLEEPPAHALFIFATTEPNKVLPTILSRCQRFDFRRIAVPEIVTHLQAICETESIQADEASLMLIAHKGDGALRDALSAFDQAVSLCGTNLVYPELAKAFGVVDIELFFDVTRHVAKGHSAGLLSLINDIIRQGYDLQEFLIGLSAHIRNLLVARTMPDTSLIEAAEPIKKRYAEESQMLGETDLLRLLMVVADGEQALKTSVQPRLQLELTLLKMAAMAHAVDLKKALAQVDALMKNGPIEVAETGAPQSDAPAHLEKKSQAPSRPTPVRESPSLVEATPDPLPEKPEPEPPAKQEAVPAPKPAQPSSPSSYQGLFGAPALRKVHTPPSSTEGDSTATVQADVIVAASPSGKVGEIKAVWSRYVSFIKSERIHVGALLQHASLLDLQEETLVISVPDEFHKRMLSNQQDFLLETLGKMVPLKISGMSYVIDLNGVDMPGEQETVQEIDPYEYMQKKRQESPVVRAIFDEFGGEMVW